ncbi:MAG: hypothetical protein GX649_04140 [Chloroflexi bacterium]|nr:hypothetical protein [Chloroflexota bacterium]
MVTGERVGGLRDTVITGFGAYASVRTARWNYHAPWMPVASGNARPPELYDRETDPDELHNVIDQHPDVAAELQAVLDERVAGFVHDTEPTISTPAAVPGVDWSPRHSKGQ